MTLIYFLPLTRDRGLRGCGQGPLTRPFLSRALPNSTLLFSSTYQELESKVQRQSRECESHSRLNWRCLSQTREGSSCNACRYRGPRGGINPHPSLTLPQEKVRLCGRVITYFKFSNDLTCKTNVQKYWATLFPRIPGLTEIMTFRKPYLHPRNYR